MNMKILVFSCVWTFLSMLMATYFQDIKVSKPASTEILGVKYTIYKNKFYKSVVSYIFVPLSVFFFWMSWQEIVKYQTVGPHYSIIFLVMTMGGGLGIALLWLRSCFITVYLNPAEGLILRSFMSEKKLAWQEIVSIRLQSGKADDCYVLKTADSGNAYIIATIDNAKLLVKEIRKGIGSHSKL